MNYEENTGDRDKRLQEALSRSTHVEWNMENLTFVVARHLTNTGNSTQFVSSSSSEVSK